MSTLTEACEIRAVLLPDADRWNASPATDVVSLKYWNHVTFIIVEGAGGVGTCKFIVQRCTTKAAGTTDNIAFKYRVGTNTGALGALTACAATGYTSVAGANKIIVIEVDAADCGPDYPYCRLHLTEVDSTAVDASITAILSKATYPQATQPISLS